MVATFERQRIDDKFDCCRTNISLPAARLCRGRRGDSLEIAPLLIATFHASAYTQHAAYQMQVYVSLTAAM